MLPLMWELKTINVSDGWEGCMKEAGEGWIREGMLGKGGWVREAG